MDLRHFKGWLWFCLITVVCVAGLEGCGSKSPPPSIEDRTFIGVSQGDREKAKEYLAKAGIKGEVVGMIDQGQAWQVDVMPESKGDGKRGMPRPPQSFQIDKATGKVQSGGV
jgi:hypothetical protein